MRFKQGDLVQYSLEGKNPTRETLSVVYVPEDNLDVVFVTFYPTKRFKDPEGNEGFYGWYERVDELMYLDTVEKGDTK